MSFQPQPSQIHTNDVGMLRYYMEQAQAFARNNPTNLQAQQQAMQLTAQYAAVHGAALQAAAAAQ